MSPTIYTHQFIDLDAGASVWFYQRFVAQHPVKFVPAFWDGQTAQAEDVILDLSCGLKGSVDADGRVHACFASLLQQHTDPLVRKALAPLARYIDLQDATGDAVTALGIYDRNRGARLRQYSINTLLKGLHRLFPERDDQVLDALSMVLDALYVFAFSQLLNAQAQTERLPDLLKHFLAKHPIDRSNGLGVPDWQNPLLLAYRANPATPSVQKRYQAQLPDLIADYSEKNFKQFDKHSHQALLGASLLGVLCGFRLIQTHMDYQAPALGLAWHETFNDTLDIICQAMDLQAASDARAISEAAGAQRLGSVAILIEHQEWATMDLLFQDAEQPVLAVVYQKGNDLGVKRHDDLNVRMDHPLIRTLTEGEAGWFFHSSGFMAARGGPKGHAPSPSRITAVQLAEAVNQTIAENNHPQSFAGSITPKGLA